MSQSDEYRANAAECQKMARLATDRGEKGTWLDMAADWLRMIPKAARTEAEAFDDRTELRGTRQAQSGAQH